FYYLGFSQMVLGVNLTVILIILTGGIHLDGLSDTFDAVAGGRTKEEKLSIMRDPHAGAIGTISMICAILLEAALLSSFNISSLITALILATTISRWSMVASIFLFKYARSQGKAKTFIEGKKPEFFIFSTAITIIVILSVSNLTAILLMVISFITVCLLGKWSSSKLGGITGDILGATNEICEVILLLTYYTGKIICRI
ncbi:MAG TPA: adenosylcobinamide-GDP ribazoletransferase, partial [Candidatus Omnitrophota bacterium]|nr:adenosylcobinamide-GDP ribazoletransferase [Candidatus Omnitrophota bacterium]